MKGRVSAIAIGHYYPHQKRSRLGFLRASCHIFFVHTCQLFYAKFQPRRIYYKDSGIWQLVALLKSSKSQLPKVNTGDNAILVNLPVTINACLHTATAPLACSSKAFSSLTFSRYFAPISASCLLISLSSLISSNSALSSAVAMT